MRTFKPLRQLLMVSLALCLSAAGVHAARAQTPDSDDPPYRVARLSYLKGDVSLKPAGTSDWADASLNRPLTTDDQLWVDRNARAELQTGPIDIQLDSGTAFSFSELSDNVLQARITDGAIHIDVRRLQDGETIEIDTPHAAITISKPGEYHIEVTDDGAHTQVKTYSGECEIAGGRESLRLRAREQATLDEAGPAFAAHESFTPRNEFDSWAQDRNGRYARSASARYVAPDVIGYEDLDGYGDWSREADYGYVWYPTRVAVGWSPYRDGHWTWVAPWGWTWVDDAPWGFAPFHYGRWAHVHDRWGWVPGPIHVRAVYAPALVGWIGLPGPRLGVSISFGANVGWFPLAPREVYVPGYNCSRQHLHNINYANTVIVNNVIINRAYVNRSTPIDYRNRTVRDAVTVVGRDAFIGARAVKDHRVRVGDGELRNWQTHNAVPAIAPERASALGPRWNANAPRTREHMAVERADRAVVVHRAPPAARASFDQEQRAVRENNNRPIPRRDLLNNTERAGLPRNEALRNESRRADSPPNNPTNNSERNDRPRRAFDRSQQETQPQLPAISPAQRGDANRNSVPVPQNPTPSQSQNDNARRDSAPRERREDSPRVWREQRDVAARPSIDNTPNNTPRVVAPPNSVRPEREAPRVEPPRSREPFQRQREPEVQRAPEVQREIERPRNIEHQRPVENTNRVEAPRRVEPPPQQEQRAQPAQPQATPPPAKENRGEERHRERGERRELSDESRR